MFGGSTGSNSAVGPERRPAGSPECLAQKRVSPWFSHPRQHTRSVKRFALADTQADQMSTTHCPV